MPDPFDVRPRKIEDTGHARLPLLRFLCSLLFSFLLFKIRRLDVGTKKPRFLFSQEAGRITGDVLLSHNLEMHYHRGCSVSLPCSEWERVGPLR